MGRTVPTYRTVLEALISDWQGFRKALRKEDPQVCAEAEPASFEFKFASIHLVM